MPCGDAGSVKSLGLPGTTPPELLVLCSQKIMVSRAIFKPLKESIGKNHSFKVQLPSVSLLFSRSGWLQTHSKAGRLQPVAEPLHNIRKVVCRSRQAWREDRELPRQCKLGDSVKVSRTNFRLWGCKQTPAEQLRLKIRSSLN